MNLFLPAMIVLVLFQNPELELAMAEEETPNRENPRWRRSSKGPKRRRGVSGVQATIDDPLALEVITVDSEDEDPRHPQVGPSGNFRLRCLNSLILQAVQLVPEPVEESRPFQEVVGPVVQLVKVEEDEPILERVLPNVKPVAVEESSPQSAVSPEIPLGAEKPLEIPVGRSREFCS